MERISLTASVIICGFSATSGMLGNGDVGRSSLTTAAGAGRIFAKAALMLPA